MEKQIRKDTDFNYAKKHTNWTNPDYVYLKNVKISEYDIRSAGLSVLKFKKVLKESELKDLENMDKHKRTVKEGLLQRSNPKIAETIVETLGDVRKAFAYLNDILPQNVISIKKDAMFLVNVTPQTTTIKDIFEFRKKSTYTSYLRIDKKEFYYSSSTAALDTKGFSSESIEKQKDFLLKDISGFLKSSEKLDAASLYRFLKTYRTKYLNRELPIETYRELDTGCFRLNGYLLREADEEMLEDLDISQNYTSYILPIINMML